MKPLFLTVAMMAEPSLSQQLEFARAQIEALTNALQAERARAEWMAARERLRLAEEKAIRIRKAAENAAKCTLNQDLSKCTKDK